MKTIQQVIEQLIALEVDLAFIETRDENDDNEILQEQVGCTRDHLCDAINNLRVLL